MRSEFAHVPREDLLRNHRKELLEDMYDDFSLAYERSYLVKILRKHEPNVLIDSVNTATGLSYQNAFDAAIKVRQTLSGNHEQEPFRHGNINEDAERLLLTQSVPALVRHIQILSKASEEIKLENYMKVSNSQQCWHAQHLLTRCLMHILSKSGGNNWYGWHGFEFTIHTFRGKTVKSDFGQE